MTENQVSELDKDIQQLETAPEIETGVSENSEVFISSISSFSEAVLNDSAGNPNSSDTAQELDRTNSDNGISSDIPHTKSCQCAACKGSTTESTNTTQLSPSNNALSQAEENLSPEALVSESFGDITTNFLGGIKSKFGE